MLQLHKGANIPAVWAVVAKVWCNIRKMKGAVSSREPEEPFCPDLLLCFNEFPTTLFVIHQGETGEGCEVGKNPKHKLVVCQGWKA